MNDIDRVPEQAPSAAVAATLATFFALANDMVVNGSDARIMERIAAGAGAAENPTEFLVDLVHASVAAYAELVTHVTGSKEGGIAWTQAAMTMTDLAGVGAV